MRRVGGGVRRTGPAAGRRGHLRAPLRGQAPQLLSRAVGPGRRRPRRGPDLHLLGPRAGRGADEQLARPRGDARDALRALPRLDGRAHHVRRALLDGPAGLRQEPHRRAVHRLGLRGRLHADHDPDGRRRPRGARRRRRLRALPALGRHAARTMASRTSRGRATPTTSTSCTSPRAARSGRSARATAATRCWARSAWPCASRRSWPATRAGWPSTCSSSSSPRPTGASSTSRAPSRARAARPTWRC